MSLSARPPSAKRAGSAAPRQGSRGTSKAGLPPAGGKRSPDARGIAAATARSAQNEVMAAVVAATGSSIFNGPPDNLFGTSEFYHKRQQKKADVYKKTGKGAPSQPVLGITVESLISEMRAQHDRMAKLKAASAAAVDGVKSKSIRFSNAAAAVSEASLQSPRRGSVARPPTLVTKDGDFGAMADAAAATLNSSTMNMPKLPPSPSSTSPDASSAALAAVFNPTPPKHAAGPFIPPPRTQQLAAASSSGGKRRGSTAVSRRGSVVSAGAGSRSNTPTHSHPHGSGRGSPDHPHKRLHFGKSTSASVGRGIMDAAKAKYQQLIEATRQVSAVIILQRWFRANRTTWQLRRQHKTEKRIAITFSRCIMKLIVKVRMNRKRREAAKAEAAAKVLREFAAAAVIQRLVRGVQARAAVVRMRLALARHRRWRSWTERRRYAAAQIVSWWFRVRHARRGRRLQLIAARRDFHFVAHQVKWHKHIRESRHFAKGVANRHHAAARVIQAAYRGHRVRMQRGMFFFLRKHDLPPVVRREGPKGARHETLVPFREWMTSPKYASF